MINLDIIAKELNIEKDKSEKDVEWYRRVVYSAVGRMALATLWNENDKGEISVRRLKRTTYELLKAYESIVPEINSTSNYGEYTDMLCDSILFTMENAGFFYHRAEYYRIAKTKHIKTGKAKLCRGIYATEASYGYEYQGDNLLIARVNLLLTFIEYYADRWGYEPDIKLIHLIANKIAWNIWQMDGRQDTVPLGKPYERYHQLTMLETTPDTECEGKKKDVPCRVFNWRSKFSLEFQEIKGDLIMSNKLFNYVIGNPPYQEEFSSDGNKTYAAPVYNIFMDAAGDVAERVELIHPARFLFNAGSTPKAWNKKMLADTHFKVLRYEEDATKIFPNTDIKGGVAITYRDSKKEFGAIKVFTKYDALNSVLDKVIKNVGFKGMDSIVITRTAYRLTEKLHEDYPEARYKEDENGDNIGKLSKGHDYDMSTNIFERLPDVFYDVKPNDGYNYIRVFGRENNQRVYKYIREDYVNNPKPLFKFSIVLPKANNSGEFGETLAQPVLTEPGIGSTETFISVGFFNTEKENKNCLKYISCKFARAMLGVLKITQDLTPDKWKYVPLQDFTSNSDIDWSKSVHEIDLQLYQKYGLSEDEIDFMFFASANS